jgi:hypothetical protein
VGEVAASEEEGGYQKGIDTHLRHSGQLTEHIQISEPINATVFGENFVYICRLQRGACPQKVAIQQYLRVGCSDVEFSLQVSEGICIRTWFQWGNQAQYSIGCSGEII